MQGYVENGKNDVPGYTWCDGQNVPKSRIDFILVSELFHYSFDNIYLRNGPTISNTRMSDHKAIRFSFLKSDIKGQGYWKMNTSILLDENFCSGLRNNIENNKTELDMIIDDQQKWESLKLLVKDFSINFSKQKSISTKRRVQFLEKQNRGNREFRLTKFQYATYAKI